MAINNEPKKATNYWDTFHKKSIWLFIILQIITILITTLVLIFVCELSVDSIRLWITIGICFILNNAIGSIFFKHALWPTRELMASIIHMLGQPTQLIVPEINNRKYVKTGFSDALKLILDTTNTKTADIESPETEAIKNQLKLLTEVLGTLSCGVVAMDVNQKILYSNKITPSHVDTEGNLQLDLSFNDIDSLSSWIQNCEATAVHAEHVWTRISNSLPNQEDRRFYDVIASYQKGGVAEIVLILIDRTSLYSVDEENLDFLSFAAHELRGPITVIRGYLDVLEVEMANQFIGDQHELFRRLIVSSNRLSGYIDNILNTSRYDRRHLKVNLKESTVAAVYDIISDDMQLRAGSQNRLLAADIPTDLPTIAVDISSMSEVFGNLIDNAIKYSNEGGSINVTAKVNGDFVDISVSDHGIGMPESVVNNLFQKFYRSHRSRETVAGTGIGLYISKAIVESHGGRISVMSEDGKGSTFIVSLPIYATVADKLQSGDNSNEGLISEGKGWIKNHSMYRG